jgi:hypothetical protein
MKFRNPWIDPRVCQVRPEAAQAYLTRRGWKPLPDAEPNFREFEPPAAGEDAQVPRLPLLEQGRDYTQRVIELITQLALAEGRYAVEVLDDILARGPSAGNGAPAAAGATPSSTP